MKYDVFNRWTGAVQFTADVECSDDAPHALKLRLAVKWAVKTDADLSDAVLRGADLSDAVLRGADLRGAVLSGAVLSDADLSGALLRGADLSHAVLSGADLSGAVLRGADLSGADLSDAVLRGADLSGALLRGADLSDAVLRGAVLRGAVLSGADLSDADLPHFQLPGGELEGWKKLSNGCVARVVIPWGAKRTATPVSRKCRAEFVITRNIWDRDGNEIAEAHGQYDLRTVYRVDEPTYADSYDGDIREECTHGIHFFLTRPETEEW